MKQHSEKEILEQNTINLEYCSLLEKDGLISLDDLGELIPGYIHINNFKDHGLEYLSKKGVEIFEKPLHEIKKEGISFLRKISDFKSLINYKEKSKFLLNNTNKTFSHFQRLQYKEKKIPFKLFYTTSKLYKNGEGIISFTQPLHMLQQNSFLKEIIEGRFVFFNRNFLKYQLLTVRECEILKLISVGYTNKTISDKLNIAYHTVKTHRKNICNKLNTGKLTDLIKFAQVFIDEAIV